MEELLKMNPNKLVQFLQKPSEDFTKSDIIHFIKENDIKMLNFRYIAGDGRLKTLNFVINSEKHLDEILSCGERVDGSSLFSYINVHSSDLYVIPRFRTAFLNPFMEVPTLDILCSFFTSTGEPLDISSEYIVSKAHNTLKEKTGMTFEALGELEFYLFSEIDNIYQITEQKGYHESHPFSKWCFIRHEAMRIISEIGGKIKYSHAEVGNITNNDYQMVQHEIEFLPTPVEEAADILAISKWVVREVAYKYRLEVSFAPKIMVGQAGSGLHFHSRLMKDSKTMMVEDNKLSDTAKKMIAGMLDLAPSLTAFGNTVPTSYLRLVPHQEAPTSICWGDRNRSVLVRVPLGWHNTGNMYNLANPNDPPLEKEYVNNQTIEIRSADGSANIHQFLAGLTVAVLHGLEMPDALKFSEKLYASKDASNVKEFKHLPASCYSSSQELLKAREIYEKDGIFPKSMIDGIAEKLKSYNDQNLSENLFSHTQNIDELVRQYIHCG